MNKIVGNSKTLVKPQKGGVFKLVLDLSAKDRFKASLVEKNGLNTTKILSLDKKLDEAQSEMLIDGCIDGLVLEADEDNYTLGISSNNTKYVFDLKTSQPINTTFEQVEVVSKRLSYFFLKLNSKGHVEIKELETNGQKVYYYSSTHYNLNQIAIFKSSKWGLTITIILSKDFPLNIKPGSYRTDATFHFKDDSITGKIVVKIKEDNSKTLYIYDQDLLNTISKKDTYEITIANEKNEAYIPSAVIKALIEKMK
jgi:hypothetical protein